MSLLSALLGELRRRALGISAEEIRYTIEDVRAEIRSVRAELKGDLARLRKDLGVHPPPEDVADDDLPEAKA
ncbi:MAG: hypothetical protein QM704_14540 [Anaeromyxobacteraceae bacterium]